MTVRALRSLIMMPFAAMADAQALRPPASEPPGISMSAEPSAPQDLTEPNRSIGCQVQSIDERNHRFSLRYEGARGYVDPRNGELGSTDKRVVVAHDPSNLFSTYGRWSSFGNRFEAYSESPDALFGSHVRLEMHRTDFEREARRRTQWAILVQAYFGWMPLTKAVGFCGIETTPQRPLSEAETREHLQLR